MFAEIHNDDNPEKRHIPEQSQSDIKTPADADKRKLEPPTQEGETNHKDLKADQPEQGNHPKLEYKNNNVEDSFDKPGSQQNEEIQPAKDEPKLSEADKTPEGKVNGEPKTSDGRDIPKGKGNEYDYLSPKERADLNDLYNKGEIKPDIYTTSEVPKEPREHLPTQKTGTFEGERGNSAFYPNSPDAQNKMAEFDKDSVMYKNGDPDFSPFSVHDSPWGKADTNVEIPHMTDQRENPTWEYGSRPDGTKHDPNYDLGNFAQADNALSEKLSNANPEHPVTPDEIEAWRKENGLTWHENTDGKSMMLVPTEIHNACPHSGGVAEMKTNMAYGSYEPAENA